MKIEAFLGAHQTHRYFTTSKELFLQKREIPFIQFFHQKDFPLHRKRSLFKLNLLAYFYARAGDMTYLTFFEFPQDILQLFCLTTDIRKCAVNASGRTSCVTFHIN